MAETDSMVPFTGDGMMQQNTGSPALAQEAAQKAEQKPVEEKTIIKHFKDQKASAKRNRETFRGDWKDNVDVRLGKNPTVYTAGINIGSDLQSELNPDWSLTTTKTANLFSQMAEVLLSHNNKQYAPAVAPFRKALNYEMGTDRGDVASVMYEGMNDIANAAGVAACYVGYAARYEMVKVPKDAELSKMFAQALQAKQLTEEQYQEIMEKGEFPIGGEMVPFETEEVPRRVDYRYFCHRIDPTSFLWPAAFTGSNFNRAAWLGFDGIMPWAQAKTDLHLEDEDKEAVTRGASGESASDGRESLKATDDARKASSAMDGVHYTRIFYWRYLVDPDERSFERIWQIVFVEGLDEPAIHEPWDGQEWDDESRQLLGSRLMPIRVCTITYISDNPIPPSDTRAGRPQVIDLRRSRSQMFMNRERSFPIRGFNANLVDPEIRDLIIAGDYQGMIPFIGNGKDAIWEVSRANYPSEDLAFDRQAKQDLSEVWSLGPAQMGQTGGVEKTKAEVQVMQAGYTTVVTQERNRVADYLIGIARVFAGLMTITDYDFPNLTQQEKMEVEKGWNMKAIVPELVFRVRPSSMVAVDPRSRAKEIMEYINITAKSGMVNVLPALEELTELYNMDPAEMLHPPQPQPPEEPAIAYRFNGKEDLQNPVVLGILGKRGQLPNPQELQAAKQYLLEAQSPPVHPQAPGAPPAGQVASPRPPMRPGQANPQWSLMSKVAKRSRELGGG